MSRVGSPWAALAVVVAGVVSGVYIFKPPLEKLNEDVRRTAEAARQSAAAGAAAPAADSYVAARVPCFKPGSY